MSLAIVVLAHVGVFAAMAALRQHETLPDPMPMTALMVEVITPEVPKPAPAVVQPSKPVPVMPRAKVQAALPTPPVLAAAPSAAPAVAEVPKTVTTAAPVVAPALPTQTPAVTQSVAAAVDTAPPAPKPETMAARFDADYLDNPKPVYPPISKRENEQGKVMLSVFVEASGLPSQVDVRITSGFERLDKAAVATVRRWKFVPARQGSQAVPAWVTVPIVFSLTTG